MKLLEYILKAAPYICLSIALFGCDKSNTNTLEDKTEGEQAATTTNTIEQKNATSTNGTDKITKENIITNGAHVKKLSQDQFSFVEGPAWDGKNFVYFTDIPNNSIYRYEPSTNTFTLVTASVAAANGLIFSRKETLLACEQDIGAISEFDINGNKLSTITQKFNNVRFNRPNDLVIDRQNGIYFTDPSWSEERPQKIKGVYYTTSGGDTQLLIDDMDKPNGIILSADESTLFIDDSDSFEIRSYPILSPGILGDRSTFTMLVRPDGYESNNSAADGVSLDTNGNLYIATKFGVQIFNAQGEYLSTIETPESPSNCVFIGDKLDTLFITAQTNVYAIKLNTTGVSFPNNGN